jgi:1-acyl-sn-glycerol-3-phosphate acyltransferase
MTVITPSRLRERFAPEMRTLRLAGMALVFLGGFAAAALFALLPRTIRLEIIRLWCRGLLAVLGVRLGVEGEIDPRPALLVANHVSWLDVLAIGALRPALFVCKSDIADWPAFGWLLARVDTIFMRRGNARAASQAMQAARARLREGVSVAVFPEGTSTAGDEVLPFSGALFQAAVDSGCPVQPLALSYSSPAAVYAYGIGIGESMLAIAGARGLSVRLSILPALAEVENRRDAALRAHELIVWRLRSGTFPAESGHAPEPEGRLVAAQGGHPGLV